MIDSMWYDIDRVKQELLRTLGEIFESAFNPSHQSQRSDWLLLSSSVSIVSVPPSTGDDI